MELGNVVNGDEDPARKAHKLFNVIKTFQNHFMEMEKVLLSITYHKGEEQDWKSLSVIDREMK